MRQILRPIGYMALVLLGGIIQILSTITIKTLGVLDYSDITIFLISFLGVLIVGIAIFEMTLIANWRSSQRKPSSGTITKSVYNQAIESRKKVIQNLRQQLANVENEMQIIKSSFSETESIKSELANERQKVATSQVHIDELVTERNNLKQVSDSAKSELADERQKVKTSQTRIDELTKERDNLKQVSNRAKNELADERQKVKTSQTRIDELTKERDNLKQVSNSAKNELVDERQKVKTSQTRIDELTKERDNLKQVSNSAKNELADERQKVKTSQVRIDELTKERDNLKQVNESAKDELGLERQKIIEIQEIFSADLMTRGNAVLISEKAWKEAGDGNETQQWKGLFSKLKNPDKRSLQERLNGDGLVYPESRSSDGRRIMYLLEKKEINIIKICEIFRNHEGNKKYNEIRTEGMKAVKYQNLQFVYLPLQTAT